MGYYDEEIGRWVAADPHVDTYFGEEDVSPDTGDLILSLAALTPKQRFVIERRFGLGMDGQVYTYREIAGALGISHTAVEHLEQRALASLRRGLPSLPL